MVTIDVLGEELWEVDTEEAKALWKSHPADRWRIWTHEEVDAHILSEPDILRELIERKKAKPGRI